MSSVTVAELQADFLGVLDRLQPGEEVIVTAAGRVVAQMMKPESGAAKAGCYARPGFWMAPDFDAPLDDFKEYME